MGETARPYRTPNACRSRCWFSGLKTRAVDPLKQQNWRNEEYDVHNTVSLPAGKRIYWWYMNCDWTNLDRSFRGKPWFFSSRFSLHPVLGEILAWKQQTQGRQNFSIGTKKKHCGDCNQSTSSHTRGKSRLLEDMWRFQHSGGRGVPSEADQTDSHMGKKGDVSGITVCWFHCATTFHVFGSIQTRIAVQGTWTHQTDGEVADQLYIF